MYSIFNYWYRSFNGRRICGTWGNAKTISLRAKKPDDSSKWVSVGGFRLVAECVGTDTNAHDIWRAWLLDLKLPDGVNMDEIEVALGWKFEERPPPDSTGQQLKFSYPKKEIWPMKINILGKLCKHDQEGWTLGIDYYKKHFAISFCLWTIIFDWSVQIDTDSDSKWISANRQREIQ